MKRLKRFVNRLLFGDMHEAFERFMLPHIHRLQAAGVSSDDIDRLVRYSIRLSNPVFVGSAPGSRLAFVADLVEAGMPVSEILAGTDEAATQDGTHG